MILLCDCYVKDGQLGGKNLWRLGQDMGQGIDVAQLKLPNLCHLEFVLYISGYCFSYLYGIILALPRASYVRNLEDLKYQDPMLMVLTTIEHPVNITTALYLLAP